MTVVLYPNGSHSLTPLTSTPLLDQIAQIAKQNGFSVLDTRPDFIREFNQYKTDFYLPNDGHPNSTAAKLIADRISKEVISKF
ncbi:hypothetical protein LEP1GSC150_3567 [Leptospira interrogans serovar Copenhageni str. LT2050]|uniref:Uncharacterized protein n=1 Tax=Leptospira interrogans serovar Copenhageni str. LT2050 TaxID=1001598 RepID=M3GC70_LEPIT|nr:hypothetical protein LEP1GSC150_3567 [Leptospira interrogans serovar Copenhageni str. LT2050]